MRWPHAHTAPTQSPNLLALCDLGNLLLHVDWAQRQQRGAAVREDGGMQPCLLQLLFTTDGDGVAV